MKTSELKNYTKEELNKILKSVDEMITIPIVNRFNYDFIWMFFIMIYYAIYNYL